jgi:hypothetical protein
MKHRSDTVSQFQRQGYLLHFGAREHYVCVVIPGIVYERLCVATARGACMIAGRRHDVKKAKRGDWGGVKDGQVCTDCQGASRRAESGKQEMSTIC